MEQDSRSAGLFVFLQIRASIAGVSMSSMTRAFNVRRGDHGLGKDGDAEPADGEIGDGARCAGFQRDVRWMAVAGLVEHGPDPGALGMHTIGYAADVRPG